MITKGSAHIGDFIYLRCESEFSDVVGDARQYSDSNGYMVFERCTVANATKGAGTWVKYEYQPINLKFIDVEANNTDWEADTTYANYGYKCDLTLTGVTATMIAEVIYAHAEAISGNYSPIAVTGAGIVTIYSKVNTTITIPTILINK